MVLDLLNLDAARHLDAARQKLPRDNFCRSIAAQLPSARGQRGKRKNVVYCPGEASWEAFEETIWARVIESHKLPRDSGESIFCCEASRCLAGPSGRGYGGICWFFLGKTKHRVHILFFSPDPLLNLIFGIGPGAASSDLDCPHLIIAVELLSMRKDSILRETQAWSGFTFLVGFLIVFQHIPVIQPLLGARPCKDDQHLLRESETTIKIKFALFRGEVGRGGREEDCPRRYFSWETSWQ